MAEQRIILASASPRRLELLQQIGIEPVVRPAHIDEQPFREESPGAYVTRMAREKAEAISASCNRQDIVIGADTSVILDGEILGKPQDFPDFRRIFRQLSGHVHQVLSAVSVVHERTHHELLNQSKVWFRKISDKEIEAYWSTGEPADKAGGYGIQGYGAIFIEKMEGSYSGIMGLPLYETGMALRQAGITIPPR